MDGVLAIFAGKTPGSSHCTAKLGPVPNPIVIIVFCVLGISACRILVYEKTKNFIENKELRNGFRLERFGEVYSHEELGFCCYTEVQSGFLRNIETIVKSRVCLIFKMFRGDCRSCNATLVSLRILKVHSCSTARNCGSLHDILLEKECRFY